MRTDIGILVAAGKGNRMLPLTYTTPKPLIKVHGKPMIETSVEAMIHCGIEEIYITVGYKKEQFEYLIQKYPCITLVENREYQTKNNISSFYAMQDIIGQKDCFICDADLYVENPDIFAEPLATSCFYGRYVPGETDEWAFQVRDGRIYQLGIGGKDDYNLVGISYWKKDDAAVIKKAVQHAYTKAGHEKLFWEEIANDYLSDLQVMIHPITDGDVTEIDTYRELQAIDKTYVE